MSAFNRFINATKRTFKKISDKTEEVIDGAVDSVKIKNLEIKIDEQYENLGRIVYRDLHTEEDLEEEKLRVIAEIDALFDRITELKEGSKEAPCEECAEEEATDAACAEEAPEADAE